MAKKGKAKKVHRGKNLIIEEKKKQIQKHWDFFQGQCEAYEARLNSICKSTCRSIDKMYADKFRSLPEDIRNMTLEEYLEMEQNAANCEAETNEKMRAEFLKSKFLSEQKKTQKRMKQERKRSNSVLCNMSMISSKSILPSHANPLLSRESRVLSDSLLATPLSKRSVVPTYSITPKFNPRIKINNSCLRRPRVGEMLMSLSGSPLQNCVDDVPDKPGVTLSLGGGKIIKITEDTEIAKLESDFSKHLDLETKTTLENVKKKLEKLLQA